MRRMADSASGARPRFVCRITPVALMTGRRENSMALLRWRATAGGRGATASCTDCCVPSVPELICSRRLASTARTDSVTEGWTSRARSSARSAVFSSSATEGSMRYRADLETVVTDQYYSTGRVSAQDSAKTHFHRKERKGREGVRVLFSRSAFDFRSEVLVGT